MKRKQRVIKAMADVLDNIGWGIYERSRCEACDTKPDCGDRYCRRCGTEISDSSVIIPDDAVEALWEAYEAGKKANK